MARMIWDQIGSRVYERGIDQGVLYLPTHLGVPWSGLISIKETTPAATEEKVWYDGEPIGQARRNGDFAATLTAITYPDEFTPFDGYEELETGLYKAEARASAFSLSWRTLLGSDTQGLSLGYKLHIAYNLLAVSSGLSRQSIAENISPTVFTWNLSSMPEHTPGFLPTAHVIIDSRYILPELLHEIEDLLYGTNDTAAQLPSLEDLIEFVTTYNRLVVTNHGDGTWTATGPDNRFEIDGDMFTIFNANSFTIDSVTYTISSDPLL